MKTNLIHYSLNTGDIFDCSGKTFGNDVVTLFKPITHRAKLDGQNRASLPQPFDEYEIKITWDEGAALFDIFDPDSLIMTTNAVAWKASEADKVWELFEDTYLRISGDTGTVSVSSVPQKPSQLPWLATYVCPNPAAQTCGWLADCEQCTAIALMADPPKQPSKGFG